MFHNYWFDEMSMSWVAHHAAGINLETLRMSQCVPVVWCQVRDVYEHVRESRERFLAAHPGLASRAPAAATAAPKPLPADTKSARTFHRSLSSKSSFKCATYIFEGLGFLFGGLYDVSFLTLTSAI